MGETKDGSLWDQGTEDLGVSVEVSEEEVSGGPGDSETSGVLKVRLGFRNKKVSRDQDEGV